MQAISKLLPKYGIKSFLWIIGLLVVLHASASVGYSQEFQNKKFRYGPCLSAFPADRIKLIHSDMITFKGMIDEFKAFEDPDPNLCLVAVSLSLPLPPGINFYVSEAHMKCSTSDNGCPNEYESYFLSVLFLEDDAGEFQMQYNIGYGHVDTWRYFCRSASDFKVGRC